MLRIMSPGIDILRKLIGGTMDFSLEEKVVGKWINGKSVYQCTFEGTGSCTLKTDCDELIAQFGYYKLDDNNRCICVPDRYDQNKNSYVYINQFNELMYYSSQSQKFVITCLYTRLED